MQVQGQQYKDIDLVIFGDTKNLKTKIAIFDKYGQKIKNDCFLNTFCFVIEIKRHASGLSLRGTHLKAAYNIGMSLMLQIKVGSKYSLLRLLKSQRLKVLEYQILFG